ncbi:MAG: proton-conducting transporter transmembrane domain-containing protein, partial [Actinomycetes bacterium]
RQGLAPVTIGWLLPLIGTTVAADGLSALFVLLVAAVTVATGVYTVGYAQRTPMARTTAGMLPLFAGAMTLVPIAASVGTFLVLWELMAGASVVLVLAEHHHAEVRAAGLLYAVMTHLGFLAILAGLVAFAAAAHGQGFAGLAAHGPSLAPGLRTLVFLLTALGFSSKAGLLPLHGWLPRAHPAAPSPVSALMSAAMVALGVYGLL